ncbi:hypothetical protein B0T17DRAFT_468840, partial [Bombardia bombarda]
MDAVLKNFKKIPCPAADRCTLPGCQWQHSWDKEEATAPAAGHDGANENKEDGGPRKRRKVSPTAHAVPGGDSTKTNIVADVSTTVKKPVSLLPLKRKATTATNTTTAAIRSSTTSSGTASLLRLPSEASKPTSGLRVPVSSSTGVSAASSPKVTPSSNPAGPKVMPPPPRKPETLNPRHLKSAAPATHTFRLSALKMLHDQFVRLNTELKKEVTAAAAKKDDTAATETKKLLFTPQELIWLALDEEEKMATDKPSIYTGVIKNRIMSYKRMTASKWREERLAELKKKETREAIASGKMPAPAKSILGTPKVVDTGLTPAQEVAFLAHLITPIKDLAQHGYVPVMPSDADVAAARTGQEASLGWEKCDRCTTRFQVFPGRREEDGALASGGKCTYHWGKAYFPDRAPGAAKLALSEKRYRCCNQTVGTSTGCVQADTHVFKAAAPASLAAVVPFAETPENRAVPKDRAVCFDCEMGYTVRGMELLRLTATSWPDGKVLLDVLVHPVGEVLDLNSRFSGVWPEDILGAEPWRPGGEVGGGGDENKEKKKKMQIVSSPMVARDLLFALIAPETPLIGHGLENDLNAVRIIHPTLIDTILLFPHPRGLPARNGLKMLMASLLNRSIQVEGTGKTVIGHDSAEDARAAGELVRLKVMEKWRMMKGLGWKLVGEEFVPPGG